MACTTALASEAIRVFSSDIASTMNRQLYGSDIKSTLENRKTMTAKEHETEAKRLRAQEKNRKQADKRLKRREAQLDISLEIATSALMKAAGKGDTKAAAALLRWSR